MPPFNNSRENPHQFPWTAWLTGRRSPSASWVVELQTISGRDGSVEGREPPQRSFDLLAGPTRTDLVGQERTCRPC